MECGGEVGVGCVIGVSGLVEDCICLSLLRLHHYITLIFETIQFQFYKYANLTLWNDLIFSKTLSLKGIAPKRKDQMTTHLYSPDVQQGVICKSNVSEVSQLIYIGGMLYRWYPCKQVNNLI